MIGRRQKMDRSAVCPPLDKFDPRDLRVSRWTNLDAAVGNPDSVPAGPELSVLASVGEPDVSRSRAVVLEHVGHLENMGLVNPESTFSLLRRRPGSYLMPLLIVPLLKVNGSRGEGLDGTAFFVQQLDVDLVLAAAVPAWCVPEDQCLQSVRANSARDERGS